MKYTGGPASFNIKLTLLIIGIFIAVATLIYTQSLVNKLQERERKIVELYAGSLAYVANPNATASDFTFALDIIKRIDFPLILTDAKNQIAFSDIDGGIRNLHVDSTFSQRQKLEFINQKIEEFKSLHEPIPVIFGDSLVLNRIYYGDSELVTQLRSYPFYQIIFAIAFIIISYISFSYLKKHEQSNIWVGMSKETAHQLGTPISSLMGWNEILRLNYKNADKVIDISGEIDNDLSRLNKIANRFSKIGSKPSLSEENIYAALEQVYSYFLRRIPNTSKKVDLFIEGNKEAKAKINPELFGWVIENLIKNALDAVGTKEGKISISIIDTPNFVHIEVEDNGKGIDLKRRKDIFRPGYSTKKRGWGLGLSLSKRIIENYHRGKIFVKNSSPNEGTTFQITLLK